MTGDDKYRTVMEEFIAAMRAAANAYPEDDDL